MRLYRYPRIEVIAAGGAVRRANGAVIGSTAIDQDGALLDFDYREVQAAQAIISNARSVLLSNCIVI